MVDVEIRTKNVPSPQNEAHQCMKCADTRIFAAGSVTLFILISQQHVFFFVLDNVLKHVIFGHL